MKFDFRVFFEGMSRIFSFN